MFFFLYYYVVLFFFFFFQAEDGIRDPLVTGVQTCALPICTAMRGRQLEHRHAIDDFGLDRNKMVRIDLVRDLEQDAALMPAPVLRRVRRPGGVARGKVERGGVL